MRDSLETAVHVQIIRYRESGIRQAIADSVLMGQRNLTRLSRFPTAIVSGSLMPCLFLVGFLLTFKRLMAVQGIDYLQYLVPIITLQAMFFTAMGAAMNLVEDIDTGLLNRYRVMPLSPLGVFGGLLIAYWVRALIALTILLIAAYSIGFRFPTWRSAMMFVGVTLLFTTVAIAGYTVLALACKKPSLVQSLLLVPYAPLLLLSTGFSPAENFPGWLQPIVNTQPVSYTATALRAFVNGQDGEATLFAAIGWLLGLLGIFSIMNIYFYRRE
jgi:ABC transporter DrrB family efflux protein